MYTCPIELNEVRYNAATQSFEATVTVHDNATVRSYACSIEAPLSMTYADAATGLSKQAIRRHQQRGGLFSEVNRFVQSNRPARAAFSPSRWMRDLLQTPGRKAA